MTKMTKEEIYNQVIKTDDSEIYEIIREHHRRMEEMEENLIKEWEEKYNIKIPRDLDDEIKE